MRTALGVPSAAAWSCTSQARCSGVWPGVALARRTIAGDLDLVAVIDAAVVERVAAAGRRDDRALLRDDELEGAGQVVVVDVRLDDRA